MGTRLLSGLFRHSVGSAESGLFRLLLSRAGPVVIFSTSLLRLPWGDAPHGAGCPKLLREPSRCKTPAWGTCEAKGTESTTEIQARFKGNNATPFTVQATDVLNVLQATWK